MARFHKWTEAQRETVRFMLEGGIIRKVGTGYAKYSADGHYIGKASIAVKTLGKLWMVARANDRIFLTTSGWWSWHGGPVSDEFAALVAAADERVRYVKLMIQE